MEGFGPFFLTLTYYWVLGVKTKTKKKTKKKLKEYRVDVSLYMGRDDVG